MIAMAARLTSRAIRAMELNAARGLTVEDVAARLGVSVATVKRDLEDARAWYDAPTTAAAYIAHCASRRRRPRRPVVASPGLFE